MRNTGTGLLIGQTEGALFFIGIDPGVYDIGHGTAEDRMLQMETAIRSVLLQSASDVLYERK